MKIIEGRLRLAASDVANFLACRRLTQLDLLRARGKLRSPREFDVGVVYQGTLAIRLRPMSDRLNTSVARARAIRPLPSRNGWIITRFGRRGHGTR